MTVHFIDVGQGDSILLIFPDDRTMLIDAGDNECGGDIASYLRSQGVDHINYLVGTILMPTI